MSVLPLSVPTTATLAAVFIPVSFMPGIVGSLFSEFGFVLAFSVTISAAFALTVCPMLAAKLGTGGENQENHDGLLSRLYMAIVEICLKLRWLVVLLCIAFGVLGWFAFQSLKQEITPSEDRGIIKIRLNAQQGSNLDYMAKLTQKVETLLAPYRETGEITNVLSSIGNGGVNRAMVVATLADWSQRERTQQ